MNGNEKEALKLKIKLWIRNFFPAWMLKLIRRRQVPLAPMIKFQKDFKKNKIQKPTKAETIAIVVPCFNHGKFLNTAFESMVSQTHLPDQIIMIDDCSSDNTFQMVQQLVTNYKKNSPNSPIDFIIQRNDKNLGQALTLNKAISLSRTDIIMIQNDDDYLMHDAIDIALSTFRENDSLALLGFSNINFDNNDFLIKSKKFVRDYFPSENIPLKITTPRDALDFEDFCSLNMTHTGSSFSREKAVSVGLYRERKNRIIRFSDRDFQIRLNLLYPVGTNGDIPLCFWRTNSSIDAGKNS